MKDQVSIDRLAKLHPLLQKRVTRFFSILEEKGLLPRITQGLRTIEEQNALYAQGRTKSGSIVTNAKGGQSWHNYGLAVDIAFINSNGSIDFNVSKEVGKIGQDCMLEWGGAWTSFKDMPHFQIPGLASNPQTMKQSDIDTVIRREEAKEPQNIVVEQGASWAEPSFVKAEKKGFTRNNPSEIVGTNRLRKILGKSGFQIQDNDSPVTYQELIVVLDRDGRFN